MNFATLQGLTIPEGAVTQIADASGRVLWSAEKVVVGNWYMRPSADIAVGHSYGGNAGNTYLKINEEVSDNEASYIQAMATSNPETTISSEFELAGTAPGRVKRITKIILSTSRYAQKGGETSNLFQGQTYTLNVGENQESHTFTSCVGAVSDDFTWVLETAEYSTIIDAINNYVASNKEMPLVTLTITDKWVNPDESKTSITAGCSTVYLEMTGECVV